MADSLHQVHILASDKTVYNAISQQEGIESWWTDHCEMATQEGHSNTFWFDNQRSVFKMRTQKLLPNRRIFGYASKALTNGLILNYGGKFNPMMTALAHWTLNI